MSQLHIYMVSLLKGKVVSHIVDHYADLVGVTAFDEPDQENHRVAH